MYAKRIIPCLDVKNGRVVKGMSFVNLVDAGNPVEAAIQYDKEGADELVLLDITATSDGRDTMVDIVEKVANSIFIPFTVGGGIRTVDDFTTMLRAGADKVSVNSAAVYRPELINEASYKFGAQCVVVAIDAKRKGDSWEVYTAGGRTPTGIDAFFGISIGEEKEIVYIVAKKAEKAAIMQAIMAKAGPNSEAHGVLLSLPVVQVHMSTSLMLLKKVKLMQFLQHHYFILVKYLFLNLKSI